MKIMTAAELRIKHLYHYQSFEKPERIARIFTEGTLYFSRPRDFNDPWDCRPCFNKSALDDAEEYERTVRWFVQCGRKLNTSLPEDEHLRRESKLRTDRQFLENLIDQMGTEMDTAIQSQYRVYCLSTHPDSTLMWSHYAASCRGVCLEFTVHSDLFCSALPVEYLRHYPKFSISSRDVDENLKPLLTKSDVWSYEDEFRLIASEHPFEFPDVPTTKGGFLPLPKEALTSVIVGAQMSSSDRETVRKLVSNSGWNVNLRVAGLVPDRYEFKITEFRQ